MARLRAQRKIVAPLVYAALALPSVAAANVNLEWRVPSQTVRVGETVEAGLYAVSDDETDQPFLLLSVILGWDATVLELIGKIDNGFPSWFGSNFYNDVGLDGLNADCGPDVFCDPYTFLPFNDGDAVYKAFLLSPNPDLQATPEGLLVTTILFTALAPTPGTELQILETAGKKSSTHVSDAGDGGTEIVTGTLGSITLLIAACGTRGDFDGDCRVDLEDIFDFGACLNGPGGGSVTPECEAALFDDDDDADLRDIAAFQREFTGPPE